MKCRLALLLFSGLLSAPLQASPDFYAYVAGLKQQALAAGIKPETVAAAFANIRVIEPAIKHDKNQPEFKLTLDSYIPRAVPQWKVNQAKALYRQHLPLLTKIGAEYDVQPRFIVALWGIETNFGKLTGTYPLISSLATLAWDGRREDFFKGQLLDALRIIEQGHVTPSAFKGSWAGAMGQVQFMPSSFLKYAVDQDGDGKKDLWGNLADVFGSAANYLQQNGWHGDETWGRQVKLPEGLDPALLGLEQTRQLSAWQALGVRQLDGSPLPGVEMQASLVRPDDAKGRAYLAYPNYLVLRHWNRSHYFVVAVGTLADRLVE
ncbi:lytic murein transglycosylase [Aeromonas popoffii]|jgi:membrane-bound lytic murein transglycosylase B|uniref:Lytic murein transglycosylase n=1 Tax=Aeromonas popoffii TaxID=70856 RepID=A0ABS5GQD8_9GAMM|nr:lytic murein transglycosylase [Aeromonas popoffii]MBR7629297.1 lytic murein transglycosylase [Aeromonas popoffii]